MRLGDLNIGERFIHAKTKNKQAAVRYEILRKAEFNRGHGSSTRRCLNESTNQIESKSCNLEVIKIPFNKTNL